MSKFFNPDPKKKRIRLTGKKRTELRKALFRRAGGLCETCECPTPLYYYYEFDLYRCGHISHIKSVGAGGDDSLENCRYECYTCHIINKHTKGI